MSKIKVTKESIISLMDEGYSRTDLAAKFGVSVGQINKLFAMLGLKGKKAKKFDFEM